MSTSKICLIIIKNQQIYGQIEYPVEDRKKRFKESLKRWRNKEYECLKCGKTYKNGYKFTIKKKMRIDDQKQLIT